MIVLNGSEAGGQFVRTAIALSAITKTPVKITNIRGARKPPGLKIQHIEGIDAIGKLCDAKINGLKLGSKEIEFIPGNLVSKDLEINISTAGSIGLILQAILLVTANLNEKIKIKINGGATFGKWAPSPYYLEKVIFPLIGEKTKINVIKDGFYPKGGAEVEVFTEPWKKRKIVYETSGNIKEIKIFSYSSELLKSKNVAERQANSAEIFLKEKLNTEISKEIFYSKSLCAGSGILIVCKTENSIFGADAIGEIGKTSENVGLEAAKYLLNDLFNGAVDIHAGDMLLPYIAFNGSGKILVPKISQHIIKNIEVLESFYKIKFKVDGEKGKQGKIIL
ncbi:MAG: RNA 3'-terminal phosphate cyclase [Candidatus Aenigmatarchaeota archaeon]|nr:RNA 3'-terminal phosphate cyclase [Candidatus Aenigmarchaeota archaeon]